MIISLTAFYDYFSVGFLGRFLYQLYLYHSFPYGPFPQDSLEYDPSHRTLVIFHRVARGICSAPLSCNLVGGRAGLMP